MSFTNERAGILAFCTLLFTPAAYQSDIVVVAEHHVFVVSSTTGQVVFQKRLEYHPAAAAVVPAPGAKLPGGQHNLVVATHNK